jgi:hypothetical protein
MTFPTEAKKGRRGLASPKQQNQSLIAGASLIDEQSLFFFMVMGSCVDVSRKHANQLKRRLCTYLLKSKDANHLKA